MQRARPPLSWLLPAPQQAAAKAPLQRLRHDLLAAARLSAATQKTVAAQGLDAVMRTELHVASMLAEMEVRGMGFEPGILQAHAAALQQRCAVIQVGWWRPVVGCCPNSMLRNLAETELSWCGGDGSGPASVGHSKHVQVPSGSVALPQRASQTNDMHCVLSCRAGRGRSCGG